MFDEMVSLLKEAKLPPKDILKKRFDAALTKKMAILKMPHTFWQGDKKINPSIEHLLWATILLEDKENFRLVEGLALAEVYEKSKAKKDSTQLASTEETINQYLNNLLELAPDESFREILSQKVRNTCQKEQ